MTFQYCSVLTAVSPLIIDSNFMVTSGGSAVNSFAKQVHCCA